MVTLIEDALVQKIQTHLDAVYASQQIAVLPYPNDFRAFINNHWRRSAVLVSYAGGKHHVKSEEGGLVARDLFFDLVILSQSYRDKKGHTGAADLCEVVMGALEHFIIPTPGTFPHARRVSVLQDAHLDMGEDKIHAYNIRISVR